ncbi:MAG: hypothetical protein DCC75_04870, partial [Proteobacteria bacterium]
MEKSAYLEKPLSEFFTLDNKILSTRSADLYSSIDRVSSEPAYLWVLRHPLEVNSDFVGRFLIRMHKIEHANPLLIPIKYHGVDPSGVGFAVLPPLSGNPFTSSARDTVEKERRFMSCLRAVERAHKQGVVFGDLCLASFWVERDGEVSVICPMGSFDAGAVSDGAMPPSETLLYLAPEQGLDDEVAIYSDVFALGVLGYFLFTEGYPYKNPSDPAFEGFDLSKVVPPSQAGHNVPPWVDEIIMRCIEPDYSSRFQSVPEIMAEISEVRRRIVASSELPVKPKKQAILDQSPALVSKESYTGRPVSVDPKEGKAEKRTLGSMSSLRIIAIGIAVFAVSLIAAWRFVSARAPIRSEFQADLSLHRAAVGENEELGRAIDVITEKRMALSEKSKKLEEIVASDDPLAHDFLVRSAIAADSQELRELSEKSIVDRARRLGLPRSAEQVRQW